MAAGQGVPPLLLEPHTVAGSWTQKAPGAEPRAGGEAGPCPSSSAGQGIHLLWAQGLGPSHRCAQRDISQPQPCLAALPAASQHREHKGKGTSHQSHQKAHPGLLLTDNLLNSLLLLQSHRLPSQQGHQMPPLPRSFPQPSLQRNVCYMMESAVISTPGLALS